MVGLNFWQLLQQKRPEMTKSGRAVADYLADHAQEAQYLSISALARACDVAEATIFRFCRALGFDGYNELKIALAQANAAPTTATLAKPEPGAATEQVCAYAAASVQDAVAAARARLDPAAVDRAAAFLQRARQVYCFGQGSDQLAAEDIWARLGAVSNKFHAGGDSHLQALSASLMGPEDVVLFVGYTGATRDLMDTLRLAHDNGAKIILITQNEASPGAALADTVLLCGAPGEPPEPGSLVVKIALLYVAEVLVLRYTLDNQELTALAHDRTARAVAAKLLTGAAGQA